jgi:hypothetical protein
MEITPILSLNVAVLLGGPIAYLRVWLARVAGNYISTGDFTAYIFIPAALGSSMPFTLTYAEWFLFGSFTGFPLYVVVMFATLYLGAAMVAADGLGMFALSLIAPPKPCWFHREGFETKRPSFSVLWFTLYGIVGTALLYPAVEHVLDWGFGDVTCDLNFITTFVILFLSYTSFCGLYRTIHRLKTGKGNWHDDHIWAQFFIVIFVVIFVFYYAFAVKGLWILDILGICAVAIPAIAVIAAAFVFGIGGSYLASFFFVYFAIIKPHTNDPELDANQGEQLEPEFQESLEQ